MRSTMMMAVLLAVPAAAQEAPRLPAQVSGPVFPNNGSYYPIASDLVIPKGTVLRHVYDVNPGAPAGKVLPVLDTAARFINSHVAAGMPEKDVHVAVVAHGQSIVDLARPAVFAARRAGAANPSQPVIEALLKRNVRIIVCGQAATGLGLTKADLLPGVEWSISASSAHALLQRQGYTLNPF